MPNRLKELREAKGISQSTLAKYVGVVRSAMCHYESGTRPIPDSIKFQLADYFGVSVDYLLGREEKTNTFHPSNEYFPTDGIVTLPIIGRISAGFNGEAVEEVLGEQPFLQMSLHGYPPEDCFLLQVKGDSMYPDYRDKDIVLVHRQTSVDSGSVAVILYNGDEATLKRVVYKPNEDWLELVPKNPEYPTKRIEGADLQECRVLGKVISIVHGERN